MRALTVLILSFFLTSSAYADLKIATWNIYWLGDGVGTDKSPRTADQYTRLQGYAHQLNADIIAVEEVENSEALAKVFPPSDYVIEMSHRQNAQRTGFAIRKGVAYERQPDYEALNVSGGLRYGTVILVHNGARDVTMMAVHLKSGCFDDDLDQPSSSSCIKLAQQATPLQAWVKDQLQLGHSFVFLGDFNRRMDKQGDDLWRMINNNSLVRVNTGQKPECYGGKFGEFIDHIVLSPDLGSIVNKETFHELTYAEPYSEHTTLSDHCPISFILPEGQAQ